MKPLSKGVLDRSNPDLVEKYAVIGSGSAECNSCQYVYEPANGDMNYPIAKGVRFEVRKRRLRKSRSICFHGTATIVRALTTGCV